MPLYGHSTHPHIHRTQTTHASMQGLVVKTVILTTVIVHPSYFIIRTGGIYYIPTASFVSSLIQFLVIYCLVSLLPTIILKLAFPIVTE